MSKEYERPADVKPSSTGGEYHHSSRHGSGIRPPFYS